MPRKLALGLAALLLSGVAFAAATQPGGFLFPQIEDYGGIVEMPGASEPARQGAKVVLDVTADSKPDEVNRGLEAAARYLNLHAQAGHTADEAQLAVVLHGGATKATLADEHFARRLDARGNPNRELIRRLKDAGVELLVCGQSLARSGYEPSEVMPEIGLAVSALTANVNKQLDGYAYIAVH
jgi:intracellular sulfur oxidation DsrE/DsrF family protein